MMAVLGGAAMPLVLSFMIAIFGSVTASGFVEAFNIIISAIACYIMLTAYSIWESCKKRVIIFFAIVGIAISFIFVGLSFWGGEVPLAWYVVALVFMSALTICFAILFEIYYLSAKREVARLEEFEKKTIKSKEKEKARKKAEKEAAEKVVVEASKRTEFEGGVLE